MSADPISPFELSERRRIAMVMRPLRGLIAEEVTTRFLTQHPDWVVRYGDRARKFGIEDAGYHLDFLTAAIESGQVGAFGDYAGWAAGILMARHIEPRFLAENLQQIGHALRRQLLGSDADLVDVFIQSGVARCLDYRVYASLLPSGKLTHLTALYVDALIRGNRQAALNLMLEAAKQGHSVVDLYMEALQPAMYRIGKLWEETTITVAIEHMATAITQYVIAHLYPLIELASASKGKIVVTGVEGEFHQIGANMIADVLEASGWDVRFLGTNTPSAGVLDAVAEHRADILGISATVLSNVPNVVRLVESVRAKANRPIRILVGGSAFRSAPLLYREIGADGCGFDLRSALALVNSPKDS